MNIKTDWISTSSFNFNEDYTRIKNNILEIYELAQNIGLVFDLQTMPTYTGYSDSPHLQMYQSIENNVETLNKETLRFDYEKRVFPNFSETVKEIKVWDYEDLNRIENMIFKIFNALQIHMISRYLMSENGLYLTTENSQILMTEGIR